MFFSSSSFMTDSTLFSLNSYYSTSMFPFSDVSFSYPLTSASFFTYSSFCSTFYSSFFSSFLMFFPYFFVPFFTPLFAKLLLLDIVFLAVLFSTVSFLVPDWLLASPIFEEPIFLSLVMEVWDVVLVTREGVLTLVEGFFFSSFF